MSASVWIINLVVLGAVYEADLGLRKITWFRLIRPILLAGVVIAIYVKAVAGSGDGLTFEWALALGGLALGLLAGRLFQVFRGADGRAWSRAGVAYATLWAVVIGARIGFVYATTHIPSFERWLGTHHLSSNAITDGLIFMAAAMLLTRTAVLSLRARRLSQAPTSSGIEGPTHVPDVEPRPAGSPEASGGLLSGGPIHQLLGRTHGTGLLSRGPIHQLVTARRFGPGPSADSPRRPDPSV